MSRRTAIAAVLLVIAPGTSACDLPGSANEGSPQPQAAAELTDDLCAFLPPAFVKEWGLVVDSQTATKTSNTATASCRMHGVRRNDPGHPVSFVMQLTTYGDQMTTGDSVEGQADDRAKAALAGACQLLRFESGEAFDDHEFWCDNGKRSFESGALADVTEVAQLQLLKGTSIIRLRYTGNYPEEVPFAISGIADQVEEKLLDPSGT